MKLNRYLSPCTKTNFKWTKNLHLSPDALKLLGGKSREDLGVGDDLPHKTLAAQQTTPLHSKGIYQVSEEVIHKMGARF